jgi:hypothetical protein
MVIKKMLKNIKKLGLHLVVPVFLLIFAAEKNKL